jgi:hypothetical protein
VPPDRVDVNAYLNNDTEYNPGIWFLMRGEDNMLKGWLIADQPDQALSRWEEWMQATFHAGPALPGYLVLE